MQKPKTQNADYPARLGHAVLSRCRRWVDLQAPYRYNLRSLHPGFTLNIGAGAGKHLMQLEGNGIGLDGNEENVRLQRNRGLRAFGPAAFSQSGFAKPGLFDSLLFAHILGSLTQEDAKRLVSDYLPYLKKGGRVIVITPQEAGHEAAPGSLNFLDAHSTSALLRGLGLKVEKAYSFPFPRFIGRFFANNESIVVARA